MSETENAFQIREPEKLPNHYDVLGLKLFESDLDLIHKAGFKRFTDLHKELEQSENPEILRSIKDRMTRLSQACTTLEVPEKKKAHDTKLAEQQGVPLQDLMGKTILLNKKELSSGDRKKLAEAAKMLMDLTTPTPSGEPQRMLTREEEKHQKKAIDNFRKTKPQLVNSPIDSPGARQPSPKSTSELRVRKKTTKENTDRLVVKQGNTILSLVRCKNCSAIMSELASICIECGFDRKNNIRLNTISSPPSPSVSACVIKKTTPIGRFFNSLMNDAKKYAAALSSLVLLLFVIAAATIFAIRIIGKSKPYAIDNHRKIISLSWEDAIKSSTLWGEYFAKRAKRNDAKPYITFSIESTIEASSEGSPARHYTFQVIDTKTNKTLYARKIIMQMSAPLSSRHGFKSKAIGQVVNNAAQSLLSGNAASCIQIQQKYHREKQKTKKTPLDDCLSNIKGYIDKIN